MYQAKYWRDRAGVRHAVPRSKHPLKFSKSGHAHLRAHVFKRDGFRCQTCGAGALDPGAYDGRYTVTFNDGSQPSALVLEHIQGCSNHYPDNLRTVCSGCKNRKIATQSAGLD